MDASIPDPDPGRPIPGVPDDLHRLDGLFRALDAASQHDCECKPLMTLLIELCSEIVFLNRMLLALHGRKMPPSAAGSQVPPATPAGQQYFVP